MPSKSKSAHWQAAFRHRMREAGLKALTVWLPKEGADRLTRYPEKERGEVITRALVLLESQGELTGNDATLTGALTGESRDGDESGAPEDTHRATPLSRDSQSDTLTVEALFTRLERIEATLSAIISNSTGEAVSEAINAEPLEPEEAVTVTETPSPPVTELTATPTVTTLPEPTVKLGTSLSRDNQSDKLPPKRIPALIRKAKKLSAQGVSWKKIAEQWNDEGIPTRSGIGKWHGPTVAKLVGTE